MVLHNVCTIHKDDAVQVFDNSDESWQTFFDTYARHACPHCTRRGAAHCRHAAGKGRVGRPTTADISAMRDDLRSALWDALVDADIVGLTDEEMAEMAAANSSGAGCREASHITRASLVTEMRRRVCEGIS